MSAAAIRADWKTRLTRTLEPLLAKSDPRPHISAYHDMPYAIFQYEPEAEFQVRQEIRQLATRLGNAGKRVKRISLAECLHAALEAEGLGTEALVEAETSVGLEATVETVHQVLFEYQPLDELVAARIPEDGEPHRDVIFIERAGTLFPFYRTSSLLEQLMGLASRPVGARARLDQVYDFVSGNIQSEMRLKISSVADKVDHPLARAVAKTIRLLQYVKSIHRTPENLAVAPHPAVNAESQLPDVKAALQELETAHLGRHGQDRYRIPTPAEDERLPEPDDDVGMEAVNLAGPGRQQGGALLFPQPSHAFLDVKLFKAGLDDRTASGGRRRGHLPGSRGQRSRGGRTRGGARNAAGFWAAAAGAAMERETAAQLFRSNEILSRRGSSKPINDANGTTRRK